ncbi:MAG: hypothetical protein E6K46_09105 [Gammaproteobacteria bacterium]|nr:MAG: hypothetical protein E6K46_09105 [Gammaproteobacteria bacterium]
MKFRLKAFALHLTGSACALTLVIGGMYLGWYRWPGWYLTGVLHVVTIVLIVDLALGPALTLILANPAKSRRQLTIDIGAIVTVQLAALIYGAITLWLGRPLYYAFSVDRLEIVQANDLEADEIALGQRQNPTLAPHWYSLPHWIWASLPENPDEAAKIVMSAPFGGKDVTQMPRYFRPWQQGLTKLRERLTRLDDIKVLSKSERQNLRVRMSAQGLAPDERSVLLMWGGIRRLLVVFDPNTLRIRAILTPG